MCGIVLPKAPAASRATPAPIPIRQPMAPPVSSYGSGARQDVEYAGFWLRFVAAFLDGLILGVVSGIIGGIVGAIYGGASAASGASMASIQANAGGLGGLIGIATGWLYHALMESSSAQGSLGKMALGLKVTDLDGYPISFGQATGRHFGKIISAIILLIGYIMAGFTEKKQALHDIMASCLVVRK